MCGSRRASVACLALALGQASAALAAFPAINGTMTVHTSQVGPQFLNVTTGAPISVTAQTPFPNGTELAVASFTGSTSGDRLFTFATNASSTTGLPVGTFAMSSVTFTQSFTTTGPRWLILASRVDLETPPGEAAAASASISLARSGQPATFSIATDTNGGVVTKDGAFAAGTFTVGGLINTSASATTGVRFGVLEGFLLNAAIADFDGNKLVNQADLPTWKLGFGLQGGTFTSGNLDGDSVVDGGDFLLWQRQYETTVPTAIGATGVVPEPASVALAVGGLVILASLSCRRRSLGRPRR